MNYDERDKVVKLWDMLYFMMKNYIGYKSKVQWKDVRQQWKAKKLIYFLVYIGKGYTAE